MAKVIIHSLFEQKLHEYVEEAYEVYGRKTARRWMITLAMGNPDKDVL